MYAGVAIEPEEAAEALARIKGFYQRFQGEVKFSSLVTRGEGRTALNWLLDEHGARAKIWYANKKFATTGKFFEYVFEPVLSENNALFYRHHFHRFVANLLYAGMRALDRQADELLADVQTMLRDRDVTGLRRLLAPREEILEEAGSAFNDIADFALGYRERIVEELNSLVEMGDDGIWTMDLTTPGFCTVVRAHAQDTPELAVICDTSKPLKSALESITAIVQADFRGKLRGMPMRSQAPARLTAPIKIAKSSRSMPGIQLADLFAGMARMVLTSPREEIASGWEERVFQMILPDSVEADVTFIDIDQPLTLVNTMVLQELAERARVGFDPLTGMRMFYATAFAYAEQMR